MSSHRNDNGCCLYLVRPNIVSRLAMLKPKQEEAGRGRSQVMVLVTRGSSLVTRGEGHLARQQQRPAPVLWILTLTMFDNH